MSELPWFKVYTVMLDDPKIKVIANDNAMQPWEILGIWTAFLSIAARSPIRGTLAISEMRGLGIEDLKSLIGWNDNYWDNTEFQDRYHFENIIQSFIELEMLILDDYGCYKIKNFETRQETKEERGKRLHRERQKRYEEKQNTVINDAEPDANMTHDSTSTSYSLINPLIINGSEKKLFSFTDAEKIYIEITQQPTIPGTGRQYLEMILDMLQKLGEIETKRRMSAAWSKWKNSKTKNGLPYRKDNAGWIDWAIADEVYEPKELSDVDRAVADIERLTKGKK